MAVYKSNKPTKDGRQYFFRIKYKDIFGISHDYSSQKYKLRKEAEAEEAIYRIKVMKQETTTSNITIKTAYLEFKQKKINVKRLKPQTIEKIDNHFKYLKPIENIKIDDLNLAKYTLFTNYLESFKMSAAYNNKILGLLKQIINYSKKYYNTNNAILDYIENYADDKSLIQELEFFEYDEYQQFVSVIDEFNWRVFFETLYFMGLRKGECQALTWKDIDFKNKVLKIRKTLTTKIKGENYTISSPKTKSSNRDLPIPDRLYNDLIELHKQAKEYKDYNYNWFVFGNSLPFKESTITIKKNNYCKLANVKQIRIHDFRHSCASLLISKGASVALVSKYLGHENINVTLKTYTHMFKSELNNITNLLNNL